MARIVVDAGHGGSDPGAVSEGRQEKDDTLRLALAVGEILQNRGQDVIFTRTEDIYQTRFRRLQSQMRKTRTFLYPYTAIPVRFRTSTMGWRHWFMMTAGLNLRLRRT